MNPHDPGNHAHPAGSLREQIEHFGIGQDLVQCVIEQHMRLQSMFQMGRVMCQSVEEGEFDRLSRLFDEREKMITAIGNIQSGIKGRLPEGECRRVLNALFAPLIKAIENGDDLLLKLLNVKKEGIIEKSRKTQMQRLVAKYSA
jgi:hypothetical protein